ncbi:MAG: M61 family metallopeptidase [Sphingobacteriaceae bacterium]
MKNLLNIRAYLILLFTACLTAPTMAQSRISFEVSFTEPQAHYADVHMQISGNLHSYVEVKMPVWTPGSYLVREFGKNVEAFAASDAAGAPLKFQKMDKNTWRIQTVKKSKININYRVYAFEISVRTSFVDASHAFLSPTGIFMYPVGHLKNSSTVTIVPHASWSKVSTGLEPVGGKAYTYYAPNFDLLYDSPIEVGNQDIFEFDAAGVKHEVAMVGGGTYDKQRLKADMAKIVTQATEVFGENPNNRYVFIVHHFANGGGGLEHLNSTVLGASRNAYSTEAGYQAFLSLVAHEYFHLWNVKRMRPIALGPFNYDAENYTTNLWIAEGFTAYYDNLFVRRAGFTSPQQYLDLLAAGMNTVANQPGSLVQSASEASFDAWIKQYRPNENSKNSTISYYDKGSVIAMLMDLNILQATRAQKGLDDVMKNVYDLYYKKLGRGYTDAEFKAMVEKVAGQSYNDFYNDYVYGVKRPDYATFLAYAGYTFVDEYAQRKEPFLGTTTVTRDGKVLVTSVLRDSPAWKDGINVNDEIQTIDGQKVDAAPRALDQFIASKKIDTQVQVGVIRDGIAKTLNVTLIRNPAVKYRIVSVDNPTEEQLAVRKKWLKL